MPGPLHVSALYEKWRITVWSSSIAWNKSVLLFVGRTGGSCRFSRSALPFRCLGQNGSNRETYTLMGWQGDRGATTNRFHTARSHVTKIPGTKAHQADLMTLGDFFTYHFGEGIDDLICLGQINTCFGRNLVNQFIFTHNALLFCSIFHIVRSSFKKSCREHTCLCTVQYHICCLVHYPLR